MTAPHLGITDRIEVRWRGAIVGMAVAGFYALSGFELMFGRHLDRVALFLMQGIPALVAGLVGGWLLAPRAAGAGTRREWIGVIVRLGLVAVVVGAVGVGMGLGVDSALRGGADGLHLVMSALAVGFLFGVAGIVFFGWTMLPVTLVAAAAWAFVMRHVVRRTPDARTAATAPTPPSPPRGR